MEQKQLIITIIAVAVIVIAAVGIYALVTKTDDNPSRAEATDVRLTVFGNANGDDYLNSDDVTYIQNIIDGKVALSDAPKVQVLTEYGTITISESVAL